MKPYIPAYYNQDLMKSNYKYIEKGKGEVIILLHGLMGAMSNFEHTINELPKYGYRVILPMLNYSTKKT